MKELADKYRVDPANIANLFTPLNDRAHVTGNLPLASITKLTSFCNKSTVLTDNEKEYVSSLLLKLSKQYSNVSALRKDLGNAKNIVKSDDATTESDCILLKKIVF